MVTYICCGYVMKAVYTGLISGSAKTYKINYLSITAKISNNITRI